MKKMLCTAKSQQLYNPIPDGCVLYLPLWHNELSGSVFNSSDDFGHICTVTDMTYGNTGRTSDGTAQYISLPSTQTLLPASGTILIWVKHTDLADSGYFYSAAYSVNANGLAVYFDAENSVDLYFAGLQVEIPRKASTTAFTLYAFDWIASGTVNGYKDGVASGTPTTAGAAPAIVSIPRIGSQGGATPGAHVPSVIGEVALYDGKVFTPAEHAYYYRMTMGRYQ